MLVAIFGASPAARDEILNLSQAKLIGTKEEQCMPFIRLLAVLVRTFPDLVGEKVQSFKVRAAISYHTCTSSRPIQMLHP